MCGCAAAVVCGSAEALVSGLARFFNKAFSLLPASAGALHLEADRYQEKNFRGTTLTFYFVIAYLLRQTLAEKSKG
jgi:hypothetical protein